MRARNIKPGFFINAELSEADYASRLLFIGLWCYADREGRFEWKPKQIKASIFPYDNVNIEKLLGNLMSLHVITCHDGVGYVENFRKHQHPHPHEAKSTLPEKPQLNQCHDMSLHVTKCQADVMINDTMIDDSIIPDSKSAPRQAVSVELPDFIPSDLWQDFLAMRKTIKKPATDRSQQLLVKKLSSFHQRGVSVEEVLNQSIINSWQDLYEPRGNNQGGKVAQFVSFEQQKIDATKKAMTDFVEMMESREAANGI